MGNFVSLRMGVEDVERVFRTQVSWHKSALDKSSQRFLRATQPVFIPEHIAHNIAFSSLTSPIHSVAPLTGKTLRSSAAAGK